MLKLSLNLNTPLPLYQHIFDGLHVLRDSPLVDSQIYHLPMRQERLGIDETQSGVGLVPEAQDLSECRIGHMEELGHGHEACFKALGPGLGDNLQFQPGRGFRDSLLLVTLIWVLQHKVNYLKKKWIE